MNRNAIRRFLIIVVLITALAWPGMGAAQPPEGAPLPEGYKNLFAALQVQLNSFAGVLPPLQSEKLGRTMMAGELSSADCSRGQNLLAQLALKISVVEIELLKKMGATAVTIPLHYPMLCREAHRDEKELEAFFSFYRYLAREVKNRGMKLILAYGCLPQGAVFSEKPVRKYYKQLAFERFKRERWSVLGNIIRELSPDFVCLNSDYEEMERETGFKVNDPQVQTDLITYGLAELESKNLRKHCQIGGGCTISHPDALKFFTALASDTTLDFLDLTISAANKGCLRRAVEVAGIAKTFQKPLAISEARLSKTADEDIGDLRSEAVRAREAYSFWAPLDQQFIELVIRFATWKQVLFTSFFHDGRLFAYVPHSEALEQTPPAKVISQSITAATEALGKGKISEAGEFLRNLLAPKK